MSWSRLDGVGRSMLVVGCGTRHEHIGDHTGCDTLDVERSCAPSIAGSITEAHIPSVYHDAYRLVMCERLPDYCYRAPAFYANLSLITRPGARVVFDGLPAEARANIAHEMGRRGWRVSAYGARSRIPDNLLLDDALRAVKNVQWALRPESVMVAARPPFLIDAI